MTQAPAPRHDAPFEQPDLRLLIRPFWRRKWLILALMVIVGGATYLISDSKPRVYTSSTNIYVGQSQALQAVSTTQFSTDRTVVNTATLLATPALAANVAHAIGYTGPPGALLGQFRAIPVSGSDFLTIEAQWPNGQGAADLANAVAREFIALRSSQERSTLRQSLAGNEAQLAKLPRGPAGAAARSALQPTIDQLQLALSLPTGGAEQVREAGAPVTPTSPRIVRNTLFAALVALLIGCAAAYGLERFDRRLQGVEGIRAAFNEPVLAVVPHGDATNEFDEQGNRISEELREPFRDLLTNIQLMSLDQPLRKLLVTSALQSEGKSTVARNLALALREYGLSVAVVDADLRRPRQVELLHLRDNDSSRGLSTVLTGQSRLEETLVEVEVDVRGMETLRRLRQQTGHAPGPWAAEPAGRDADADTETVGGLQLLPAGPLPANPQAVLGADRTRQVIDDLAARFDIVVIDSPPLLAVSDAVPLLAQSDAVIIVSRQSLATRDTTARLKELLARIPGHRWIGVVANGVRLSDVSYGYAYSYGYRRKGRTRLEATGVDTPRRDRWWRRGGQRAPTTNGRPPVAGLEDAVSVNGSNGSDGAGERTD